MQQLSCQQKLKPWMGFALFAVLMALFYFVCGPMQDKWGMTGLIATEAVFLVLAIAYGLILRIPLKEMFPVKKFSAWDFFGSLFLTSGGVMFGLISIAVVGIIYPGSLAGGDVQALSGYIGGGAGYIFTMFALAVAPAICEEAIHRGAIISNFRSVKKDWVIVLIMGLFFGIFHLSTLRFINTAIMGACLSYIVVKKNNMLLSSLMHFIINLCTSTLSYVSGRMMSASGNGGASAAASAMTGESMKPVLASYLMIGVMAPFLIVLGLMLLDPSAHRKIRFLFAGILSVIMLAGSFAITLSNSNGANTIVKTNLSYTVDVENSDSLSVGFDVGSEGDYTVAVTVANTEGRYYVRIENENGDKVAGGEAGGVLSVYSEQISLGPGSYNLYVTNGPGTKGEKPVISVQIMAGFGGNKQM